MREGGGREREKWRKGLFDNFFLSVFLMNMREVQSIFWEQTEAVNLPITIVKNLHGRVLLDFWQALVSNGGSKM